MTGTSLYNPFYPWTRALLNAMLEAGHKWFVRQSFPRGKANESAEIKQVFIISHYNDLHQAEAHFSAISHDPYAFFYDVGNAENKKRLEKTVEGHAEYRFFSNTATPDWKQRLERYEHNFRSYIENVLDWHPKGKETVVVGLHSKFGELYVTLKYFSDSVRIPLFEIENHNSCATTSPFSLRLNWQQNTSLN